MDSAIWSAVIGAGASIIAAVISVGYIGKIIHKEIAPSFFSYSEPRHNLWNFLRSAEKEIIIVVAYGDQLLRTQRLHLKYLLKKGIKIKYLMLGPKDALDMSTSFMQPVSAIDDSQIAYQNRRQKTKAELESVLDNLEQMEKATDDKENMEVRQTDLPLTASYIAIDLSTRVTHQRQCNAMIQMMVYQFGVTSRNSPISYLTFKNDKKQFESTADSILKMWDSAKPLVISAYRKELNELLEKEKTPMRYTIW